MVQTVSIPLEKVPVLSYPKTSQQGQPHTESILDSEPQNYLLCGLSPISAHNGISSTGNMTASRERLLWGRGVRVGGHLWVPRRGSCSLLHWPLHHGRKHRSAFQVWMRSLGAAAQGWECSSARETAWSE